jgi:hypothetical protein
MAPAYDELREELLALAAADQAFRSRSVASMSAAVFEQECANDLARATRISEIITAVGWPGATHVGEDGSAAAWLLVQHADHDVDFQKRALLLLKHAVAAGEAAPRSLAYLSDRVCVNLDQPQIYGTQFHGNGETFAPFPIADPVRLEKRRANLGLEPFAENELRVRQLAADCQSPGVNT